MDLGKDGYCVIENVLGPALIEELRAAMYRAQARIVAEVGAERLERAGEIGVLRLMLKYEPVFLRLLELPEMLAVVDQRLGKTAILHLQNGFILPSLRARPSAGCSRAASTATSRACSNGYLMSLNTFFAIDDFTRRQRRDLVVPGTPPARGAPGRRRAGARRRSACECPRRLDDRLRLDALARGGRNISGNDRLAVNQQFTRSYVKQQIDYVRALGDDGGPCASRRARSSCSAGTRASSRASTSTTARADGAAVPRRPGISARLDAQRRRPVYGCATCLRRAARAAHRRRSRAIGRRATRSCFVDDRAADGSWDVLAQSSRAATARVRGVPAEPQLRPARGDHGRARAAPGALGGRHGLRPAGSARGDPAPLRARRGRATTSCSRARSASDALARAPPRRPRCTSGC